MGWGGPDVGAFGAGIVEGQAIRERAMISRRSGNSGRSAGLGRRRGCAALEQSFTGQRPPQPYEGNGHYEAMGDQPGPDGLNIQGRQSGLYPLTNYETVIVAVGIHQL